MAVAIVAVVATLGASIWFYDRAGAGGANVAGGPTPTNYTVVPYSSSVDDFPLSYAEWLPSPFDAAKTYPLVVYLHGQGDTNGTLFYGGTPSDIVQALNGTVVPDLLTTFALVNATRADQTILIAPYSRTGSGWYINSPCGGPQEQDVLDAIASEEARHHISGVYLLGHSMGTEGVLYLASQHPSMFAGVGVIAPVTDLFEDVAYRQTLLSNPNTPWANASIQAKQHLFCGTLPGPENATSLAVARMFQNMSPLRFDPSAFLHIPIYVTAGGADDRAPDSTNIWSQWMNANNTLVNATCNFAPQLGEPEPPNCATQTLNTLHQSDPTGYTFRFVYERFAGHDISQIDPADLLAFWFGQEPGGYYLGTPLSGPITPAPGLTY